MLSFSLFNQVYAQDISATTMSTGNSTIGDISNLQSLLVWAFNFFQYLGWSGVLIGIGFVIFALIYKLFNADNEEAMKTVQGYITKAVLIVIAGLLLLSVSFVINFVAGLFGATVTDINIDPNSPTITGGNGGGATPPDLGPALPPPVPEPTP